MNMANDTAKDPRFCINLEINKGWATSIDLESEDRTLPPHRIMIDYDKLPIVCRVCMSWKHKASDCKEFQYRFARGRGRPTFPRQNQHQGKGKNNMVDEDSFQLVTNRKHTMRNIFVERTDRLNVTQEPSGGRSAHEIYGGPGAGGPHAVRREETREAGGWMGEIK